MSEELFTRNIVLLEQKNPSLATRLIDTPLNPSWAIIETRTGTYTLKKNSNTGDSVLLHSAYNPEREAQQLVASYEITQTADLVFAGFGLGYHVKELLTRGGNRGFIVIVEQDIEVLKYAFSYMDLTYVLTLPNILWIVGEPPQTLFKLLKDHTFSILTNGVSILDHPPSIRQHKEFYDALKQVLSEVYTWAKVNLNTHIAKADTFAANVLENMREIIAHPGICHLRKAFSGKPFFLVSAGPSLDKNIHYLREVGDRGMIITVDSAMQSLLDKGIVPDIVVSIDFSEHNEKYLKDIGTVSTVLVFDPEIYPPIVRSFSGRKFVIMLPGKSLCEWIGSIIGDKGRIEKGLSVSHTAFLLALYMGAAPIIFLGQDLSYPRGSWHSKGSHIYQKADVHGDYDHRMIDVQGYFGSMVQSETSLKVFLKHFEGMIGDIRVQCFNATEGGAKIEGFIPISLRDAIVRFCTDPIDKSILQNEIREENSGRDSEAVERASESIIRRLETCNHNAYSAFQNVEAMLQELEQPRMNHDIIMTEYKKMIQIIQGFSHDEEILRIIKDNAIEALMIRAKREVTSLHDGTMTDREEIRKYLNKERLFFSVLMRATDFLTKKLSEMINGLRACYVSE